MAFDVQADLYTGTCPDYYSEIAAVELEGMATPCDLGTCDCVGCVADRAVFTPYTPGPFDANPF